MAHKRPVLLVTAASRLVAPPLLAAAPTTAAAASVAVPAQSARQPRRSGEALDLRLELAYSAIGEMDISITAHRTQENKHIGVITENKQKEREGAKKHTSARRMRRVVFRPQRAVVRVPRAQQGPAAVVSSADRHRPHCCRGGCHCHCAC